MDGYECRDGDVLIRRGREGGFVFVRLEEREEGQLSALDIAHGGDRADALADVLYHVTEHFGCWTNEHDPDRDCGVFVDAVSYREEQAIRELLEQMRGEG